MATPKAVLDAEAEADRLIAEMAGATLPPGETGEITDPTLEGAGEDTGLPDEGAARKDEPAAPPAQPDPGAAGADLSKLQSTISELTAKLEKLQASYDTLRGKTYAEVPRVLSENKALKDKVEELERQLAAKTDPAAHAPAGSAGAKASSILAELKEDVNEEVADKILRLVNASIEEGVAARMQPFEGKIDSLQKTATERAQDQYLTELTRLVPDWKEIAVNPKYAEYLQGTDEVSGRMLYDLAADALARLDAKHMSVFFRKFKKDNGMATDPAPAGGRNVPSGKAALVGPRGGSRGAAPEPDENKADYITTTQLERWARERRNMTEEQEAKLDARIDRAIANRWIVPG